jgi:hypothetical protein
VGYIVQASISKNLLPYQYKPNRTAKVVDEIFGEYKGIRYSSNGWICRIQCCPQSKPRRLLGHERRKFVDCIPKGMDIANSKTGGSFRIN